MYSFGWLIYRMRGRERDIHSLVETKREKIQREREQRHESGRVRREVERRQRKRKGRESGKKRRKEGKGEGGRGVKLESGREGCFCGQM